MCSSIQQIQIFSGLFRLRSAELLPSSLLAAREGQCVQQRAGMQVLLMAIDDCTEVAFKSFFWNFASSKMQKLQSDSDFGGLF